MLLARDGHTVTVVEKDPQPPAESADAAWVGWDRPGVAQWRQAHFMMPRFRHLLDAELPAVRDELVASGATRFNILEGMAPSVGDRETRPGDERFGTLTARRPVLERAVAAVAGHASGVEIRRGASVAGPIGGPSIRAGIPNIVGVRTTAGEELHADLIVDAMGRRSKLAEWAAALGGRPPFEEAIDAGFAYYTRHYHSRTVARTTLDAPADLIEQFDRTTEEQLTPWYWQQVDGDRLRAAAVQAIIDGRPAPEPADRDAAVRRAAFFAAAGHDADVARAAFEIFGCLSLPGEVMSRPEIARKVMALASETPEPSPPATGPDRATLLALVAA